MSATGFSFEQLATHLLQGFVEALPCQEGETEARAMTRTRTTIFSIMAFLPRDALEMMLSGQVVMHNALIQDSARDILRGQTEALKARTKSTAVALSRLMLAHLSTLRRAQTRPAEGAMETRQQTASAASQTPESRAPESRAPESRAASAPAPASAASPAVKPSAPPPSPLTVPCRPAAAMPPVSASRGVAPSAVAASVAAPSTIALPIAASGPPPAAMHPSVLPPLAPPFSAHPPAATLFAPPETMPGSGRGPTPLKQSLLASTATPLSGPMTIFPGAGIARIGVPKR